MAIAAPSTFYAKTDIWQTGNSTAHLLGFQEPMIDVMPYQYSPPPSDGHDLDVPHSAYIPSYSIPPEPSRMDIRSNPHSSTPGIPGHHDSFNLKHSLSTSQAKTEQTHQLQPHNQDSISDQSNMGLSGDKKRNKLGYHRTSVACGHCRHRKIRCIPDTKDTQGRCANCLRLKKECSFFPVDQQPPTNTRQKSVSRSSVGPKVASASSSPAMSNGQHSDLHGGLPIYQPLAAMQSMPPHSLKLEPGNIYPPDSKMSPGASTARTYPGYTNNDMANWMAPDASPERAYSHASPLTQAFSPYTPHGPPASTGWTAPASGDAARDDMYWAPYAPAQRSVSFGADGMSSQSQQYSPNPQMTSKPYGRKASTMYSPTMATTVPAPPPQYGTPPPPQGPAQPTTYSSWHQPYPYSKPGDSYGPWYGESGSAPPPMGAGEQQSPGEYRSPGSGMYYTQR